MISLFEKPRFKVFANSLSNDYKKILSDGYFELLLGDEEKGFNPKNSGLIN